MTGMRILLVDDNYDVRRTFKSILERQNYEVVEVSDGTEAVEITGKERFDLIVSDIGMSKMSGSEMIEKIRQAGITTPALIITGFHQDEAYELLEKGLVYKILSKPVRVDELIEAAKQGLEL
jgi:CheY-like chemotaxis protein